MRDSEGGAFWAGTIFGLLIAVIILFLISPRELFEREAVKNNAAHYQVDEKGNVTFHWNAEAKEPQP